MATPRSIEVHVEDLVLHGFAAGERRRIAAALQQELSRLIREEGMPGGIGNPRSLARLAAATIQIRAGSTPRTTGAAIGMAVYRSMQQPGRLPAATRPGRPAPGVRNR